MKVSIVFSGKALSYEITCSIFSVLLQPTIPKRKLEYVCKNFSYPICPKLVACCVETNKYLHLSLFFINSVSNLCNNVHDCHLLHVHKSRYNYHITSVNNKVLKDRCRPFFLNPEIWNSISAQSHLYLK